LGLAFVTKQEFRMTDRECMETAIDMAAQCETRVGVPKVGAIIAVAGDVIAAGHRGEHDHAELVALQNVRDWAILPNATVYTTLEPCTHHVRRESGESCTERLGRAQVKKVYVGILDPNQGVCGKGILELQDYGIEVELFPPDLAQQIKLQNDAFILDQKKIGIEILDPTENQELETYRTGGIYTVRCKCKTQPGGDIFAFTHISGQWWPQPHQLRQIENSNEWTVDIHFGAHVPHTIHIVRARDAGVELINYYRKIISINNERLKYLKEKGFQQEDIDRVWGGYPGIAMTHLPKGLVSQAMVTVRIAKDPAKESRGSTN
jgi:pyrimidine deaminase RibD-like protein